MVLREYQTTAELGTLYRTRKLGGVSGTEQLQPNIYVDSGTVDIRGSNSTTQPATLAAMALNTENTNISGILTFAAIPSYIAITQNTGTSTEIILSGVSLEDLGAIS